jgi:aryl-alcohol dehydrogenase-like predicted oxidoreductase
MSNLILGGAQFGNGYGKYVKEAKLNVNQISAILESALKLKITEIDVAENYAGVTSQLANISAKGKFKINSKIKFFKNKENELTATIVRELSQLKIANFNILFIHNWSDLDIWEKERALQYLRSLKKLGYILRAGISVYDVFEIKGFQKGIDVIQAPLNYFKLDFIFSENASQLKNLGVEFQARSIFNQGVLLNPNSKTNSAFPELQDFVAFCRLNALSLLEGSISIFQSQELFSKLIVGVISEAHVRELVSSINKLNITDVSLIRRSWDSPIADPRKWKD